ERNVQQSNYTQLKNHPFGMLVLDEAHHLRTSWWRSTIELRDALKNPKVVALTATPPYDTSLREWDKYITLCGPIDAEIYVPELVKEGELCPHQDYIYFTSPTKEEAGPIHIFHQHVKEFYRQLTENESFTDFLENHPWVKTTEHYTEEILSMPSYFFSMLIYLKEVNSDKWSPALQLITDGEKTLPTLNLEWLEEMLTFILFQDEQFKDEEILQSIHRTLSRIGAIKRRKVTLKSNQKIERLLTRSTSKLESIEKIVRFESDHLQDDLRMVILADYIFLEDLPNSSDDQKQLVRLGVIPIFEQLRRKQKNTIKLGVLTGSVVILPVSALSMLEKIAEERHFVYETEPLPNDSNYVMLKWKSKSNHLMVSVLTKVFQKGGVECIVGTAALLGEGWDAPSINSLIMASYVGTFMLSNQMRGRAIRAQENNPNKTANIWHLVCVDLGEKDAGYDFQSIQRRFDSSMGLHVNKDILSTGIERMDVPFPLKSLHDIKQQNEETMIRARNRMHMLQRWKNAIKVDREKKEVFYSNHEKLPRPFVLENTIMGFLYSGLFIFLIMMGQEIQHLHRISGRKEIIVAFIIIAVFSGIRAVPFLYKALKGLFRNITLEKNMNQVAKALYQALYDIGLLQTALRDNKIYTEKILHGSIVVVWLKFGTIHEQKLFLNALHELLDPIQNPRYLLYRRHGRFWKRKDYHAIPEEIGKKKEYVELFLKSWQKYIDQAEYIYTRTQEGRKKLLIARTRAMSALSLDKSKRISEWR